MNNINSTAGSFSKYLGDHHFNSWTIITHIPARFLLLSVILCPPIPRQSHQGSNVVSPRLQSLLINFFICKTLLSPISPSHSFGCRHMLWIKIDQPKKTVLYQVYHSTAALCCWLPVTTVYGSVHSQRPPWGCQRDVSWRQVKVPRT